jgi:alpha-D-xyloside xylohydrolase
MKSRGIPVGVVVLDSPWETNYNTFIPAARYHDFAKLVSDMKSEDVHVVLWITQLVNRESFDLEPGTTPYPGPSPNLAAATAGGYLVNHGQEFFWWKGIGGALDFFDRSAVAWWHRQQDGVLDAGISGWKLDFGDSYVQTDTVATAIGTIPHQRYSEEYYRDFFAYGVNRRGADAFVTMTRAWDESYQFPGRFFARPEHSPAAWMGDNRRDWVGIVDAIDEMFLSAEAGYVVVGSDIGGYLERNDKDLLGPIIPFDPIVFARWTALGALCPLMELHGQANFAPWTVPERTDEIVALYQYWATLHHELIPFFYGLAEEAYQKKAPPIVRPVAGQSRVFMLGDALLVAPIIDATQARQFTLPSGARWYDWWSDDGRAIEGGTTLTSSFANDLARIPLFIKEGAIIPADVSSALTGLGDVASTGLLTVSVHPGPASTFVLHDEDSATTSIAVGPAPNDPSTVRVSLSRRLKGAILRIRGDAAPARVTDDGAGLDVVSDRATLDAKSTGAWFDAAHHWLWVKVAAKSGASAIDVGWR